MSSKSHPSPATLDREGFIQFFESIPSDRWLIYDYVRTVNGMECCCALGHLGRRNACEEPSKAVAALADLFGGGWDGRSAVAAINNPPSNPSGSYDWTPRPDPAAKDRILSALRALPPAQA